MHNKNWDKKKHRKRYLELSVFIFVFVGFFHLLAIINNWHITVGETTFPLYFSWFAFIMAAGMVMMGGYYLHED